MENGSGPARRPGFSAAGYRRVLLVGFMGSGKSTVGSLLASRLGWGFLDFDREIERRAGASVARIFRDRGERWFRALEAEVGAEALGADRCVLASGGGWATVPGRLEGLGEHTLVVWLRVGAEVSLARLREAGDRPLLEGPDPLTRARTLLQERVPHYQKAKLQLDSERASPEELARAVMDAMKERSYGI